MKIITRSIASSVASNEPTFSKAERAKHDDWQVNRDEPMYGNRLQLKLRNNQDVKPVVPQLPSHTETPKIASKAKRFVFGLSVLLGVSVVPVAIASLALGPIGVGVAAGCLLAAIALHKIANRMS